MEVPISTVNRLCSSGLQSIVNIANSVKNQQIELGMAVGVESMSLKYAASRTMLPTRSDWKLCLTVRVRPLKSCRRLHRTLNPTIVCRYVYTPCRLVLLLY